VPEQSGCWAVQTPHPVLRHLLARCIGYYGQAHLTTNEWRALAGCSPGTWIAEELPFLQDEDVFSGED
jgi:hypothetical protein